MLVDLHCLEKYKSKQHKKNFTSYQWIKFNYVNFRFFLLNVHLLQINMAVFQKFNF